MMYMIYTVYAMMSCRYKDGVELRNGTKYRIIDDGDRVQLVVKGVAPGDAGEITCELSNSRGKESASAKLQVQSENQRSF